jgi:hypothetical protein
MIILKKKRNYDVSENNFPDIINQKDDNQCSYKTHGIFYLPAKLRKKNNPAEKL